MITKLVIYASSYCLKQQIKVKHQESDQLLEVFIDGNKCAVWGCYSRRGTCISPLTWVRRSYHWKTTGTVKSSGEIVISQKKYWKLWYSERLAAVAYVLINLLTNTQLAPWEPVLSKWNSFKISKHHNFSARRVYAILIGSLTME